MKTGIYKDSAVCKVLCMLVQSSLEANYGFAPNTAVALHCLLIKQRGSHFIVTHGRVRIKSNYCFAPITLTNFHSQVLHGLVIPLKGISPYLVPNLVSDAHANFSWRKAPQLS